MAQNQVAMSVVIPCRNERKSIESCIRSIFAQEPPVAGLEIIVADGMSDDGTREILIRLASEDSRLRIFDNPKYTAASGINTGIHIANGDYIAIMGAHNRYSANYVRRGIELLEELGVDNVGGSMFCEGRSRLQRAIAAAHHSAFSAGGARWHNPDYEGPADTVFGGIYRRTLFDRIGFFDEEVGCNEDDEFNLRLARSGGRIWQSPRIKSWYIPRSSLGALFRQQMRYGYYKVRVIRKHKLPGSIRHLVPASFIFLLTVITLLSLWLPVAAWTGLALVVTYFTCNAAASFLVACRHGLKIFPFLPSVFASYHFGYGLGFLLGIWDFVFLHRQPVQSRKALSPSYVSDH